MRVLALTAAALVAVPSVLARPLAAGGGSSNGDGKDRQDAKGQGNEPESPPEGYGPEEYHQMDEKYLCAKFDGFAQEADFIFNLVNVLECGDDECWDPVRKAIYELEYGVDVVDTDIDNSDRSQVWSCSQEGRITGCYLKYANVLIKTLNLLKDRTRYIDHRTSKFINLAVNSLRASDHVLVYELVRRMQCEEHQMAIMEKHGATDGTTPNSVREAFGGFAFTPLITGDDFKNGAKADNNAGAGAKAPGQDWPQGQAGDRAQQAPSSWYRPTQQYPFRSHPSRHRQYRNQAIPQSHGGTTQGKANQRYQPRKKPARGNQPGPEYQAHHPPSRKYQVQHGAPAYPKQKSNP